MLESRDVSEIIVVVVGAFKQKHNCITQPFLENVDDFGIRMCAINDL